MSKPSNKNIIKTEFGDFQTPDELASEICQFVWSQYNCPQTVIEPTCGKGSFLLNSLRTFHTSSYFLGIDINNQYLDELRNKLHHSQVKIELIQSDFFAFNWKQYLHDAQEPILIIGNPPWVTNAELSTLNSINLPHKANFQQHRGLDAITGKSNFDISEWMLIHLLEWVHERHAVLAMLCKTTVARKVLKHAWKYNFHISDTSIHIIDAKRHFNISTEACLLVCKTGSSQQTKQCVVYEGLSYHNSIATIGFYNSEVLPDLVKYQKWSHFQGKEYYKWRSGVKHDCAKVMELTLTSNGKFTNGLGEMCDFEEEYLYPLFKGSDVANNNVLSPQRWIVLTQKRVNDDTSVIQENAPKTWQYLLNHASLLDNRKSSIYKDKPRFAIFGVGDYTFAPWKIAICGFYKRLQFSVISSFQHKPAIIDDTCYSISCKTEDEARLIAGLLNSDIAQEFLSCFIFWDTKRPITVDILKRIDLLLLARQLGKEKEVKKYIGDR